MVIRVDGRDVPAHIAEPDGGWAICADLEDVFIGALGVGSPPDPLDVARLTSLSQYPMPSSASDNAFFIPPDTADEDELPPPAMPTIDTSIEPTRLEDLNEYLNARFPCNGHGPLSVNPDGTVQGACVCGRVSGPFSTQDEAIRQLDAHIDAQERARENYIVSWFARNQPDMPVHINGVRRR